MYSYYQQHDYQGRPMFVNPMDTLLSSAPSSFVAPVQSIPLEPVMQEMPANTGYQNYAEPNSGAPQQLEDPPVSGATASSFAQQRREELLAECARLGRRNDLLWNLYAVLVYPRRCIPMEMIGRRKAFHSTYAANADRIIASYGIAQLVDVNDILTDDIRVLEGECDLFHAAKRTPGDRPSLERASARQQDIELPVKLQLPSVRSTPVGQNIFGSKPLPSPPPYTSAATALPTKEHIDLTVDVDELAPVVGKVAFPVNQTANDQAAAPAPRKRKAPGTWYSGPTHMSIAKAFNAFKTPKDAMEYMQKQALHAAQFPVRIVYGEDAEPPKPAKKHKTASATTTTTAIAIKKPCGLSPATKRQIKAEKDAAAAAQAEKDIGEAEIDSYADWKTAVLIADDDEEAAGTSSAQHRDGNDSLFGSDSDSDEDTGSSTPATSVPVDEE